MKMTRSTWQRGAVAFAAGMALTMIVQALFGPDTPFGGALGLIVDPILYGGVPLLLAVIGMRLAFGSAGKLRLPDLIGYLLIVLTFVPVGAYWVWGEHATVTLNGDLPFATRLIAWLLAVAALLGRTLLSAGLVGIACWLSFGRWYWLAVVFGAILAALSLNLAEPAAKSLLLYPWYPAGLARALVQGSWVGALAAQAAITLSRTERAKETRIP